MQMHINAQSMPASLAQNFRELTFKHLMMVVAVTSLNMRQWQVRHAWPHRPRVMGQ